MKDIISVPMTHLINPDDTRDQINALFTAKRLVSLEVENLLDDVVDLLDGLLIRATEIAKKRGNDEPK